MSRGVVWKLLLLGAVLGCARHSAAPAEREPFRFHIRAPLTDSAGHEVWDAIAFLPGDSGRSGPASFRIRLDPPGQQASPGSTIHGVLSRGDPGGSKYFLITFGPAFIPQLFGGKAGMQSGGMALELADSLPLTAIISPRTQTDSVWHAVVRLVNGGQFVLALDSAQGSGEFRPIGHEYDEKLFAVVGLVAPRRGEVVPSKSPNER